MQTSIFKRIAGLILVAALVLPMCSGCASKTGPKKNSGSVFAFPSKKDSSPKKPQKDPNTPLTMGEVLMQPRNNVL